MKLTVTTDDRPVLSDEKRTIWLGYWENQLTCFRRFNDKKRATFYVPSLNLLEADGSLREWALDELLDGRTPTDGYDIFEKYFKKFPVEDRKLAAYCDPFQWLALDALCNVPDFKEFLKQEIRHNRLSFIFACWALYDVRNKSLADRNWLNTAFLTKKRTSLLRILSRGEVSKSEVRIIEKLEAIGPLIKGHVDAVLESACYDGFKEIASQFSYVTADFAVLFRKIPKWLHLPEVLSHVNDGVLSGIEIDAFFEAPFINAPEENRRSIRQSLKACDNVLEVLECVERWNWRLLNQNPFPPPPVLGNELLRPLISLEMLEDEGHAMCHCVGELDKEVWCGAKYYYRWDGQERATVELTYSRADRKWSVTQILGQENRPVSEDTWILVMAIVMRELRSGAPVRQALSGQKRKLVHPSWLMAVETYIAGLSYYQASSVRDDLVPGVELALRREPTNPHDRRAIEVLTKEGVKLGYIPRADNREIARKMDGGKTCFAIIADKDNRWETHILVTEEMPGRVAA